MVGGGVVEFEMGAIQIRAKADFIYFTLRFYFNPRGISYIKSEKGSDSHKF